MPLITQITRNGELIPLRWGDFHVAAMALAASFDEGTNFIGSPDKVYDAPSGEFAGYPEEPFPITGKLAFMLTTYPMLAKTPLNDGVYTLTKRHKFMDQMDGEILELLPGDELRAVRNM